MEDNPTKLAIFVFIYICSLLSAMAQNTYAVEFECILFANPDGNTTGTYNDLIYQVYLKNYDTLVEDTTMLANRSQYVDFTLPYTESGVSMVVPIKDKTQENTWACLKLLTWDLWMTSACFFVFIGFVVWVLEHRINEDFQGPPTNQVGTFSTMVFAHRERVVSNLGRFVVIIWAFVVLILTQSYVDADSSAVAAE